MIDLRNQHGQRIDIGRELGRGGEGAVFDVPSNPQLVAKLYHKNPEPDKCRKLSIMSRMDTEHLRKFAAWPVSTLHRTAGNELAGILMPRIIGGHELHELYGPSHRRHTFPKADWRFLLRAAVNCATVFHSLHEAGVVLGDVNQGNVFATNNALIRLIDCDSYQISDGSNLYRCEVGVGHFTPPELQQASFRDVTRTPNHDCFGLAVLIFHLLFMGRHPYAGVFSGQGDMPIERAISEDLFAYDTGDPTSRMRPPPNSLQLSDVTGDLANLFRRTFTTTTSRPTAKDWASSLTSLERQLSKCADDPGHYYLQGTQCPWCKIENAGGPNFFISISVRQFQSHKPAALDISLVIRKILQCPPPSFVSPSALPQPKKPRPLQKLDDPHAELRRMVAYVATISLPLNVVGLFWVPGLAFTLSLTIVFGFLWMALALIIHPAVAEKQRRKRAFSQCKRALALANREVADLRRKGCDEFDAEKHRLAELQYSLSQLDLQEKEQIRQLQASARERQLIDYLDSKYIANSSIPNIGPTRKATLQAYGIETALDVKRNNVQFVPGFGPSLASDIHGWLYRVEASFRFIPSTGVPTHMISELKMRFEKQRRKTQNQLLSGPEELSRIARIATQRVYAAQVQVEKLKHETIQAKLDLSVF